MFLVSSHLVGARFEPVRERFEESQGLGLTGGLVGAPIGRLADHELVLLGRGADHHPEAFLNRLESFRYII